MKRSIEQEIKKYMKETGTYIDFKTQWAKLIEEKRQKSERLYRLRQRRIEQAYELIKLRETAKITHPQYIITSKIKSETDCKDASI